MKFKVIMKDPDGVYDSLQQAAEDSVDVKGLDEDEVESLVESRKEKLKETLKKWFEYSEYLTVEIDTDAMTCVVVPR